jgi:ParB/RepB/Spo0J family partition protein
MFEETMLSGSFRSYPISSITVSPDRQRKELSGIEELASSIRSLGLIHPIVLTPDGVLVAGERRLRAHQHLGLTHITVQFTTDLPQEELEAIELEENVKRKALSWKEEVTAVARLHALKQGTEESWTASDTAELLSVSNTSISRYLLVADYLAKEEPLVVGADNLVTAHNICLRKEQRAEANEATILDKAFEAVFNKPTSIEPTSRKPGSNEPTLPLVEQPQKIIPYLNDDFRKWATTPWSGPKFNFIHCDFPYGINYDKHNGGATGLLGKYADTPELYLECLRSLKLCMADRVAESAHLMFWLSARHEIVHQTRLALEDMGWKVAAVPLIWHRSDNSGVLPDPQRGPRQVYEVCLFGSRGDRKIVQAVSNLFAHPKTKEIHASEKPRPMLQHFFRMFVDESTVMLDPTMGSGNSILAAEESSPQFVLGIEALPEIYANALVLREAVKRRE